MKEIPITGGKIALVDDEDFEWINQLKWHLDTDGYAIRTDQRKSVYMHRLINKTPQGLETDHINHNKLDNRSCNLRSATRSQNQYNREKTNNKTSGKKGVCWDKSYYKWRATIVLNGKKIHIGRFTDIEEASNAYQTKARELFGEFAC